MIHYKQSLLGLASIKIGLITILSRQTMSGNRLHEQPNFRYFSKVNYNIKAGNDILSASMFMFHYYLIGNCNISKTVEKLKTFKMLTNFNQKSLIIIKRCLFAFGLLEYLHYHLYSKSELDKYNNKMYQADQAP